MHSENMEYDSDIDECLGNFHANFSSIWGRWRVIIAFFT
jgi:hypothetical protein